MKNSIYIKTVLITGASSGIGLKTAEVFAKEGYKVYALARHKGPSITNVTWLQADVTDPGSLEKVLSDIDELGIVIHCAGCGISGSAEHTPIEAARRQMEVNYFGAINVNHYVLPILRKNPRSLVMFTSSFAGLVPIPFQSHYSSSKYALEAYAEALGMEARPYGVRISIIEPGDTKTGFTASRTFDEPEHSPYYSTYMKSIHKMEQDEINGMSPSVAAKLFLKQAQRRNPRVRVAVGLQYKLLAVLVRLLSSGARDSILSKLYCPSK